MCRALEESLEEAEEPSQLPLALRGRYTRALPTQLGHLLLKDLRAYWRTPEYNATRLFISMGVSLIFGSMYWMKAHHRCVWLLLLYTSSSWMVCITLEVPIEISGIFVSYCKQYNKLSLRDTDK